MNIREKAYAFRQDWWRKMKNKGGKSLMSEKFVLLVISITFLIDEEYPSLQQS